MKASSMIFAAGLLSTVLAIQDKNVVLLVTAFVMMIFSLLLEAIDRLWDRGSDVDEVELLNHIMHQKTQQLPVVSNIYTSAHKKTTKSSHTGKGSH